MRHRHVLQRDLHPEHQAGHPEPAATTLSTTVAKEVLTNAAHNNPEFRMSKSLRCVVPAVPTSVGVEWRCARSGSLHHFLIEQHNENIVEAALPSFAPPDISR